MSIESKESKLARLNSDWVEDAVNLQRTSIIKKRYAVGITLVSCALYTVLYSLVSDYREKVEPVIRELPIFTRIVLNIFQPFLVVFIIISLSLLILFYLKMKKSWFSYKALLALMVFNGLFAATLLVISILKVA